MSSRLFSCCIGCYARKPGYHGKCTAYLADKEIHEQLKQKNNAGNETAAYTIGLIRKSKDRDARKRRVVPGK